MLVYSWQLALASSLLVIPLLLDRVVAAGAG